MSGNIDDKTRQEICRILPVAIEQALHSYEKFIAEEKHAGAKAFSVYHAACKAAITHLELLLKLARAINLKGENNGANSDVEDMLVLAQEHVTRIRKKEGGYNEYSVDSTQ